jgi:3-mercaptopyruvate sulfurtransferase SseA
LYDQTLGRSFLLDPEKTHTAYCFNHKVASTTWMALYARLDGDEEFLEEMKRTQLYYK